MDSARAFLLVRIRSMLRGANLRCGMLGAGLLATIAWKMADLSVTASPHYMTLLIFLTTLVLVLHGIPAPSEYRLLRTAALTKADRIVYIALSLAWSSISPLVIAVLAPLFSLVKGFSPPWLFTTKAAGIWMLLSATGAFVVDRIETKTPARRGRTGHALLTPPWFRKEAGLLLTRSSDWLGPIMAVISAVLAAFVFPQMRPDMQIAATRVTGFLLMPILAEPFIIGIAGAEGRRAWLHAIAPERARTVLLRKAFVGAVYVGLWSIPFQMALVLLLPRTVAMSVWLQFLTNSIGTCNLALVLGIRFADLERGEQAQKLHPIHGLFVGAVLFAHATVWVVRPDLGYLLTPAIVFGCAVWLWRQETFTSLHLWRNQCR